MERGIQGERFTLNNKRKIIVIIEHKEDISSNFEGTIIDIETVGGFSNQYPDSRRYKNMQLVIFGFILMENSKKGVNLKQIRAVI